MRLPKSSHKSCKRMQKPLMQDVSRKLRQWNICAPVRCEDTLASVHREGRAFAASCVSTLQASARELCILRHAFCLIFTCIPPCSSGISFENEISLPFFSFLFLFSRLRLSLFCVFATSRKFGTNFLHIYAVSSNHIAQLLVSLRAQRHRGPAPGLLEKIP